MTTADIFNVGSQIRAKDGTVYEIKAPTLYQQGEFQRWLELRAHDAIDRDTRPSVTDEQRDRRHAIVDRDAGMGKYEWDGPFALQALWTPAGMAQILLIVCRDQVATIEKAEELLRDHMKEVATAILVRAVSDPKAREKLALLLGALGLPTDWMASAERELFSSNSSTRPSTEPSPNSAPSQTPNSSSCTTSDAAPTG